MKSKCVISAAIFFAILFFSINVFGYSGGTGEANNPYKIANIADFNELTLDINNWNKSFCLTADINLAGQIYTQAPIAPDTNSITSDFQGTMFTGVFNGNNHKIFNLTIIGPGKDCIGLFGCVGESGQVVNLGLEDINITGRDHVGGITGQTDFGTINVCHVKGSITGIGSYYVGGLVGYTTCGSITSCYAECIVSGAGNYVGGIVGQNTSCTINICYAAGSVSGTSSVGGLVGRNYSSDGDKTAKIAACYATSSVSGTTECGGLVGFHYGGITINSFWDIQTSGQTSSAGGTGKSTEEMKNIETYLNAGWSFLDGEATYGEWVMPPDGHPMLIHELYTPITLPYLKGLTQTQGENILNEAGLLIGENYSVYDTSIVGGLVSETFPKSATVVYAGVSQIHLLLAKGTKFAGGDGVTTPYQIANIDHWFDLMSNSTDWNKRFILTADIDLNDLLFTQSPISPDTRNLYDFQGTAFTGIFDGNGHSITNLTISSPSIDYIGLFGKVGGDGQIMNLGVENVNTTGRFYVGGLAGYLYNASIANCYTTGSVSGTSNIGGLLGVASSALISSCYSSVSVTGFSSYIGGLAGTNYYNSGSITSSKATGSVNGGSYIGGLAGYNSGLIKYCNANGSVIGGSYSGGLIGYSSETVTSCKATGNVTGVFDVGGLVGRNDGSNGASGKINNCYATGEVNGAGYVGGLIGYNYGLISYSYAAGPVSVSINHIGGLVGWNQAGTPTACFWDIQTSGINDGIGNVNPDPAGVRGKTTVEMMTLTTFTGAGWDFNDTDGDIADWMMLRGGEDYPRLSWEQIITGDIAGLYGVDFIDYAEIASHWGQTGCPSDCDSADINNDGTVDINDLMLLADKWLQGI